MLKIYRNSFGKITAMLYIGGAVMHCVRLLTGFAPNDIPFLIDWVVTVGAAYGAVGFVLFASEVDYRGTWQKVVHVLIASHLLVSAGLHLWIILEESHEVLKVFPLDYSYAAVLFFAAFAWVAATLRFRQSDRIVA